MNTSMLTKRDKRADKILPNPSNRQIFGYMAIRQWEDGTQSIDYSTFGSMPADCETLADNRNNSLCKVKNDLAPIVGYIGVSIAITRRMAK